VPPKRPKDIGASKDAEAVPPSSTQNPSPAAAATAAAASRTPETPPQTQEPVFSQTEGQADLAQCKSYQSKAQDCCSHPETCGGTTQSAQRAQLDKLASDAAANGDQASLTNVCGQAYQAGFTGSNLTNDYAGICSTQHNACETACAQLSDKWNAFLTTCSGNCDSASVTDLISQLGTNQQACSALSASEDTLKQAALSTASNAGVAAYCAQVATGDPAAAANALLNQNDMSAATASLNSALPGSGLPVGSSECGSIGNIQGCLNCQQHPEFPSCGGSSSVASIASSGSQDVSAGAGTEGTGGSNTSSNEANSSAMHINPADYASLANSQAPALGGIRIASNARALPIEGGGGGSAFPPLNPGNVSSALLAKARAIASIEMKTDILKGERGGSAFAYKSTTGYESMMKPAAASPSHASTDKNYRGLDLKDFLPGGSRDPRGLAGLNSRSSEIGPAGADLFERMSIKFKTLCATQRLLDCN
jgi:hypothetical protein